MSPEPGRAKPQTTKSEVISLLNKGLKPYQVAQHLGITQSAVHWHLKSTGGEYKTPLQIAKESVPFREVDPEHKKTSTWARIMNHAEYMATGGRGMSPRKLEMLRSWYNNLEELNVVVVYDPSIPPSPGAKRGGWGYAPREEKDGALLLRVNDYVEMNDAAYELWRLPARRP